MSNPDQAAALFTEGYNCAQSVLAPYAEALGIPRHLALRLAAPFGGGIGCSGETCGAVTGALMVLGLKLAAIDPKDPAAKQKNYQLAQEFITQFETRHRTTICRDLLGCDISTPAGMQQARDQKLFATICPPLVKTAAELVDSLLATS